MSSSQGVVLASDQSPVSIAGTVGVSNFPLTQNVSGSVAVAGSVTALQGTNPWTVQLSSGSVITTTGNSSVQVVGLMPPQSVSGVGTFNVNPIGNGSIIGTLINSSVTALQGTNPWVVGNSSVQVVGLMPAQSVSGVGVFNIAGSVAATGSVTALQGTNPWVIGNSSVQVVGVLPNSSVAVLSVVPHSVAALQGTNPWVIGNSSVMLTTGTNVIGSVAALQGTQPWLSQVVSSVAVGGTYPVNATSVLNGLGMLVQGVRNDTLASVISSVDGAYSPFLVGPVGELVTAQAPISKWTNNIASVNTGVSVIAVAAGGAGIYNYITTMQLASFGANSVLATIATGPGITSVRFYGVIPTGTTQLTFDPPIKSQNNAVITASINAATILYITAQGFSSKT